jgi:hypothetical protein
MTHKNWLSLVVLGALGLSVAACDKEDKEKTEESVSSESEGMDSSSSMDTQASEDMVNSESETSSVEPDGSDEGDNVPTVEDTAGSESPAEVPGTTS